MTITVQTPRSGPFSGDGSTVAFSYNFLIDDEDELVVVVADVEGVETVQTITTDYTVSGVGNVSGGTVTFVTAPTSSETVSIRRATSLDQGLDLQNRGAVVPQLVEDTFDEVVKMVQDQQEQLSRAIKIRVTANVSGIDVPAPEANKILGWNAAGDQLVNLTPNTDALIDLPASSTDNAVVRFDGVTGNIFQNSVLIVSDDGDVTGVRNLTLGGTLTNTAAAPVFRLDDSDVNGTIDFLQSGADAVIDVDPGDVDASSQLIVNVDGAQRVKVDADGAVIGTGAADRALRLSGTDAIRVPVGTTAQRPGTPEEGDIRRNTSTTQWEGYDGASWGSLGGAGLFKGENGESGDSVNGAGDIFRVHEQTLNTDVTIDADENASATGPLTVASGVTLTVTSGGSLAIV